ncbi:hypothetical protein ES705_27702 [subsurface metagenome]
MEPDKMSDKYYEDMERVWADSYPSVSSIEDIESFYRESGYDGGFTPYIQKILSHPSIRFEKARLLEFGCDNGIMLNYFKGRTLELYGVDINSDDIRKGRELFPEFNLVRSFGLEIPFKNKYFDVVFLSGVLKHIRHEDRAVIYQELARVADFIIASELNSRTDTIEENGGFRFYNSNFIKELTAYFDEIEIIRIGDNFHAIVMSR